MSQALVEEVFEVVINYATVREVGGNNRGPMVEQFLRNVGLPPGEPWCAAFVYSVVDEAAKRIALPNPLPKTGGVGKLWRSAPQHLKIFGPRRGCIFIHLNEDGHGHTGFVEAVHGETFGTWEGNSNAAGSRDGGGVWHGVRPVSGYALGFIDLGLA